MNSPPRLVVDVVCVPPSQIMGVGWEFGSLSAVFGEVSEKITSILTMNIDSFGDQHEWVDTEAVLYEADGTYFVKFGGASWSLGGGSRGFDVWERSLPRRTGSLRRLRFAGNRGRADGTA